MGSDSAEKHRQRGPGRAHVYVRLSVVLVAVTTLFFFTREPAGVAAPLRHSHQLGGSKQRQLERQNARRLRVEAPTTTGDSLPVVVVQPPPSDAVGDVTAQQQQQQQQGDEEEQQLTARAGGAGSARVRGVYRLSAADIDGVVQPLGQYMGQVSIIVNVASKCGYTASNYEGLQGAYDSYKDRGFTVLAFPCNQFGRQEPGTEQEIKAFAASKGATFPIFAKVDVNGAQASPVWDFLKLQPAFRDGGDIRWNFEKALVGRTGQVIKRYGSAWDDAQIRADIEEALNAAYDEVDALR